MLPRKLILTSIILMSFLAELLTANCYFIRLNGYNLDKKFDVFSWGELSPLIGLEAGDYFHLSPSGQNIINISNGEAKNLQGELYYIPQNLIDKNNTFSLKMMVLERDDKSPDDLVLPLSEKSISLTSKSFFLDSLRTDVTFQPFSYSVTNTAQNKQSYQFEILRDLRDCSLDTTQGQANDQHFRLQNKLKQLNLHVKHYEEAFLSGGQEYKSYRLASIKEDSLSDALDIAETIATVNSSELISLGLALEKLRKVENFSNVWREYRYLIQHLLKQKINIKYMEEKDFKEKDPKEMEYKEMEVPSLRFHSDWEKLTKSTGILPPNHWNVQRDR